jgi:hypothetical protein
MIAFTLLVGEPYWEAEAAERATVFAFANQAMRGIPEPASVRALRKNVKLAEEFDAWFSKMTSVKQEDRFQSPTAAIAELAVALDVPLIAPGNAASADCVLLPLPSSASTTTAPVVPDVAAPATRPVVISRRVWVAISLALVFIAATVVARRSAQHAPSTAAFSVDAPVSAATRELASPLVSTSPETSPIASASAASLPLDASAFDAGTAARRPVGAHVSPSASSADEYTPVPASSRRGMYSRE